MESLAFREDEVLRLTELSAWRVNHWRKSGVILPDYATSFETGGARLYSFQDLIALRVLAQLRKKHSLQALRRIGAFLRAFDPQRPWSRLRLYVNDAGGLFVKDPATGRIIQTAGPEGQVVEELVLDLVEVSHRLQRDVDRVRKRPREEIGKIHRKRGIVGRRAVIMGTRIPVDVIKRLHGAGVTVDELRRRYPRLTGDDVNAALAYSEPKRTKTA